MELVNNFFIEKFNPDVIVYIDYPGFNLRIARWAKKRGYRNHYYISPQIWAWNENRISLIKKNTDCSKQHQNLDISTNFP